MDKSIGTLTIDGNNWTLVMSKDIPECADNAMVEVSEFQDRKVYLVNNNYLKLHNKPMRRRRYSWTI